MRVPKEVILDLLPIYLAGEVDPVTRAWVEEYLAQDPEMAEQVRRGAANPFDHASPPLPPELELQALRKTRRTLTLLRWLFGVAMAFSATVFALEVQFRPLKVRLLLLDYPAQLLPLLAAAVACWTAYFLLRARLRAT